GAWAADLAGANCVMLGGIGVRLVLPDARGVPATRQACARKPVVCLEYRVLRRGGLFRCRFTAEVAAAHLVAIGGMAVLSGISAAVDAVVPPGLAWDRADALPGGAAAGFLPARRLA